MANRKGTTGGSRVTAKEPSKEQPIEREKVETPQEDRSHQKARYDEIHTPDDTFPGSGPNHPEPV
ncbi:MAG: hypothetical protein V4692_09690 [Bdellovibrionota bacterium]